MTRKLCSALNETRTRIGARSGKKLFFLDRKSSATTVADMVRIKAILFIVALTLCSGCGTVMTGFDPNPYPIYGGVRQDARVIGAGGNGAIFIIDIPLSLAMDTILLPVGLCNLSLLPPSVDPLKGWNSWHQWDEESHPAIYGFHGTILVNPPQPAKHSPLDQAIKEDYKNYLTNSEPGYFESDTSFFEDNTGQHAVRTQVGRNGYYRIYIFIYDKNNTRIKVIKYANGGYAC
jgi:uncharacterized protein YceK